MSGTGAANVTATRANRSTARKRMVLDYIMKESLVEGKVTE